MKTKIAIIAVIVSSLNKEEKKKPTTIVTDKQEVKSEYRLKGNHLQEFDLSFLKIENKITKKSHLASEKLQKQDGFLIISRKTFRKNPYANFTI